jgi:hypothetical protein
MAAATPARHYGQVTACFDTTSFITPSEGGQLIKCYAICDGKCLPIGAHISYELGSDLHDGTPVAVNVKVGDMPGQE